MANDMFNQEIHAQAAELWRKQSSALILNPGLQVLNLLRGTYPSLHVAQTSPEACDLVGYAQAGFATSTLGDSTSDHVVRFYDAPGHRLDAKTGKVADKLRFGAWTYTWESTDFLVYQVVYQDTFYRDQALLYVLHAGSDPTVRHSAATDALLLAAGLWTRELHDEIYVFDSARWVKSKELYASVRGASWDDVVLEAGMKARLASDAQDFFGSREAYAAMRVPWKRGLILHGLPGNGKTVSIKALVAALASRSADEGGPVPSLYVKSLDACAGPKWSIQAIFAKARNMAPCLLVFEDLDSMVTDKTRSYFLNEVDGLESNEGILMVGSTNHLDRLDAAVTKRPSRFDRKYHFRLPDEAARAAYCEYWRSKFEGSGTVEFPDGIAAVVAKMTPGFSFAYLQELFVASLLALVRGTPDEADDEADVLHSDSGSSSGEDAVVVEKEEKAEAEALAGDGKGDETKKAETKKEAPKPKAIMPEVEIPEALKDNVLMRMLQKQAAALFSEMDNSDDVPRSRAAPSCDDSVGAQMFTVMANPSAC